MTRPISCRSLACVVLGLCAVAPPNCQGQARPFAARPEMVLQVGHDGTVSSLAFSPDDRMLVTAGQDWTVKLWDVVHGELVRSLPVDGSWAISTAFSPDSRTFVSFMRGGKAVLTDAATGKRIRALNNESEPAGAAFSPDGKVLALGGHSATFSLWDTRTGRKLRSIRAHSDEMAEVGVMAFSADGSLIATSAAVGFGDKKVEIWRVATGELVQSLEAGGEVHSLAFSPRGGVLAVGAGNWIGESRPSIELWDLATKTVSKRLTGHRFDIVSVAFSHDGRSLASGDAQGILKRWDLASGAASQSVGLRDFHIRVAVSPDATLGAAPSRDGSIRVYDLTSGKLRQTLPGNPVQTTAFAFGPESLVSACTVPVDSSGRSAAGLIVGAWDLRRGGYLPLAVAKGDARNLAVDRAVKRAVTSSGEAISWDLMHRTSVPIATGGDIQASAVAIAPDGAWCVIAGQRRKKNPPADTENRRRMPGDDSDPALEVYDTATGRLLHKLAGHSAVVTAACLTADGKTLLTCGYDAKAILWDTLTWKQRRTFSVKSDGASDCAAITPDGRFAVVGYEYQPVRIYNTASGRLVRSLAIPALVSVGSICTSRDGKLVATACNYGDDAIRVWSAATGKPVAVLDSRSGYQAQVGFMDDGRTLASLDGHGALRLWDSVGGRLRATLRLLGGGDAAPPEWLASTPEGYYTCSRGAERHIRWRVAGRITSASELRSRFLRPDLVRAALARGQQAGRAQQGTSVEAARAAIARGLASLRTAAAEERKPQPAPATPNEKLAAALDRGKPADIKALLDSGADPNTGGRYYHVTPLMVFARNGDMQSVKELIARKVDLNAASFYGDTALTEAAAIGRDDIIQVLLDAGADVRDKTGTSLLSLRNDPKALGEALLRLLPLGNPLELRLEYRTLEVAYLLVYLGADLSVRDKDGQTALIVLSEWQAPGHPIFRKVLARGADPNAQDKEGRSALLNIALYGGTPAMAALIEHGANVNLADRSGWTPLMAASQNGHTDAVRLLLDHGADPNLQMKDPQDARTAIMFGSGHLDIWKLLLDHGYKVNLQGYEGWSALTYAVISQDLEGVKLLLAHGADPSVRTKEGKTLLQLLKEYDKEDAFGIGPVLRAAGAH